MYSSFKENCGCDNGHCNHPSGECSGSCYNCLYQIHFPERAPENSKTEYDCVKMLYHYVCQYSHLYTREILCAFENEWSFIKDFPYFHILHRSFPPKQKRACVKRKGLLQPLLTWESIKMSCGHLYICVSEIVAKKVIYDIRRITTMSLSSLKVKTSSIPILL